ncbi:Protein translocase subunit SecD [subsurface metagenome]|nr:protein translocase subunit SecD [bacterium]
MKRSLWIKLVLFILALVIGGVLLYPTLRLLVATDLDEEERMALEKRALHLGLDLVGGMHLVLEADTSGRGFSPKEVASATDNAISIIRDRVDDLGVSEPNIQRVGRNRMQVQLPGIADRERALEVIGKTGLLEFRLLASHEATLKIFSDIDAHLSGDSLGGARPFSGYLVPAGSDAAVEKRNYRAFKKLVDETRAVVPSDAEILFGHEEEVEGRTIRRVYVVKKRAEITGADVKDAKAKPYSGNDPNLQNTWVTDMDLQRSGQTRFAQVTGNNVGERLAIVFDDVVKSAPVIKERIPPGSAATITSYDRGGDEMRDLAILIRHGALPVPLRIVEERTVSPTLGRDSIRAGVIAIIIGLAAVVLFIVIYYTGSGFVAVAALIFNLFGLLAILAGFRATLTLPGLAAIALTIGMAVDANVLIYERIREELMTGKFPRSAVETGYSKAWRVIIDANITTIIAAIILAVFNSGPVRGFAITLIVGLIINMVTAIYFSKGLFDLYLFKRPDRKLYI